MAHNRRRHHATLVAEAVLAAEKPEKSVSLKVMIEVMENPVYCDLHSNILDLIKNGNCRADNPSGYMLCSNVCGCHEDLFHHIECTRPGSVLTHEQQREKYKEEQKIYAYAPCVYCKDTGKKRCNNCSGLGIAPGYKISGCPNCAGSGFIQCKKHLK